jgi:RNA-binding protein
MKPLSPAERRALRARAHSLHPVVIVGGDGLGDSVVAEIERSLKAHELIKIRVPEAERGDRDELLNQICERTGATAVQHIGKVLVVYRQRPEKKPKDKPKSARRPGARNGRPALAKPASRARPSRRPASGRR